MGIHVLSNLYDHTLGALISSEHVSIMPQALVNESEAKCSGNYTEITNRGPRFLKPSERNFHCARLAEHKQSIQKAKDAAKSAVELVTLGMLIIEGLSYLMPVKHVTAGEQIKLARKLAVSIYLDSARPKRSPDTVAERPLSCHCK